MYIYTHTHIIISFEDRGGAIPTIFLNIPRVIGSLSLLVIHNLKVFVIYNLSFSLYKYTPRCLYQNHHLFLFLFLSQESRGFLRGRCPVHNLCGCFVVSWEMKLSKYVSELRDPKSRSCLYTLFPTASLLCLVFFIGSAFIATDTKENLLKWGVDDSMQNLESNKCKNQCRPSGSEALPKGIVSTNSNLEMRPLWGFPKKDVNASVNLLAVAVGIKQKVLVNKMVRKFLANGFVVMLFHYDGIVDKWKDFEWSHRVIHVSAVNQTKWWFAKRFLHPEIVVEYDYIFLWDEDLGVEQFDPKRYLSIVKDEGLEISQPGLDPAKSELHHQITVRGRRSIVHRRTYKPGGFGKGCDEKSTAPPCTGWIEVMAPVFSRAAWRCVWYMIQNDLIHAWGLDMQLGYCAQGDRTKNVGVVDSEYIVHHGLPTLGGVNQNKTNSTANEHTSENENIKSVEVSTVSHARGTDFRVEVRRQSYIELDIFRKRWTKAAEEDKCWIDPYPESLDHSIH